jgi:hypothetical protein
MAFFSPAPGLGHRETGRNREISDPTEDLASRQELVFFGVDRMRLHFHYKLACQPEDPLQAIRRLEWWQYEEEV